MATITTGNGPAETKKPKSEPRQKTPKEPKAPVQKAPPAPVWASPIKPSLVLLPPKARGLKARRRAVRQSMLMSLGLLGLTAAAYVVVLAGTAGAQAELDKEKAITNQATAYLAQNRDVQNYADGFVERKAAVGTALENDVAFSKVVQAVYDANSVGAVFTSIKTAPADSQCMSSSPFAPSTSLGCIDVAGKAPNVEAVAKLVASLNKNKDMLAEPYLTESTVAEGGISFKFIVGHTSQALSLKGDKFKPSPEELSSIASPTAATGAAASGTETQGAAK
jgi:ABC-type lipoprotein release transport system permease subunit